MYDNHNIFFFIFFLVLLLLLLTTTIIPTISNVGTSNYQWGYFYQVAGSSFNSEHPLLVDQLTSVFLRDWTSQYATSLSNFTEPSY